METTQVPAVTGIDGYVHDVVQYNTNSADFFDSAAKFANNIIDSVSSAFKYLTHISVSFATMLLDNPFPSCIGTAIGVSLFFLYLDFARNRGG